jgi:hypothetical protein
MTEHRFDTWTTVLRNPFGLEIHNAWFVPRGWPGHGPVVNLGIPECELQINLHFPRRRASHLQRSRACRPTGCRTAHIQINPVRFPQIS